VSFSLTVPWNRKAAKLVGVPTGVSFYVDDLEHTFQQLKRKRVHFNFGPRQESWGGRLANFEDPDGNKFFLLQMPPDFGR
jgi:catechol 2,3-dioxygenase-like lactoylglutathione lyase family enzyme